MRGALMGSALVHLVFFVVLVALQARAPRFEVGPEVIRLALIEPTASSVAPRPPAPAKAETKAPELIAEPGTGVKIAPPKPRPKPETKAPPPAESQPTPAVALPSASMGQPGLQGDLRLDSATFEFGYYLLLLRNRVAQNWAPPAGLANAGPAIRAMVFFRVRRDGSIQEVRLESPSGVEFFDRSAVRAVQLGDPMPPLPEGYTGASLGVHFGFTYSAP